jgi:hypothetical protein
LLAILSLALLGLVTAPSPPAGAQIEPALVVTPSADLLDGQTVEVAGSGFLPSTTVYVVQCPAGVTDGFDCDFLGSFPPNTITDSTGSFSLTLDVRRDIVAQIGGQATAFDCAVDPCTLGAGDISQVRTALAPIEFADVPRPEPALTVTPDTDLDSGDFVEVVGTGFPPNRAVSLYQCAPEVPTCPTTAVIATSDASGSFTTGTAVARVLREPLFGDPAVDCLVQACTIQGRIANAPIADSALLTFTVPQLTITIDELATLKAGTNHAVASAEIECDRPTPVSVHGTIAQPDTDPSHPTIIGTHTFDGQPCAPDEPLLAFVPARTFVTQDLDFMLGPAAVEVTATPTYAVDEGPATAASAIVELIDFDEAKAVIDLQLADPANGELRAAVLRAIVARLAQDLVFRLEFIAALGG